MSLLKLKTKNMLSEIGAEIKELKIKNINPEYCIVNSETHEGMVENFNIDSKILGMKIIYDFDLDIGEFKIR